MQSLLMLVAMFGALVVMAGCEQTPQDRQAEAIRHESQQRAEDVRKSSEDTAETVRDQAGRDVLGSAKTEPAEEKADAIESEGERKADAIEKEGERKADAVEETKPNVIR
jgi:hypothetical protein